MSRRRAPVLAALAPGAASAWLYFVGAWPERRSATTLRPDDARVLSRGREVYGAHCAACHGARLQGQPNWRERGADGRLPAPPHDASGHTWHHPDEMLFRLTKHGVAQVAGLKDYASAMPAYDGVHGDDGIVAVLSWIKSQWSADVRAGHDAINRQAGR